MKCQLLIRKKTFKNTSPILKKIFKYKTQIPVYQMKISGFISLLKSGVIPKQYDSLYNNIHTTITISNTILWHKTNEEEARCY